jgi:hypothetical protein
MNNSSHPTPHWLPSHPDGEPIDAAADSKQSARPEPQSGNGQQNSKAAPFPQSQVTQDNLASRQSQRAQPQGGANGTQGSGAVKE